MVAPLGYSGRGNLAAIRGRTGQRPFLVALQQQAQRGKVLQANRPHEHRQQNEEQRHIQGGNPLLFLPSCSRIFFCVGPSLRCSSTVALAANRCASPAPAIKPADATATTARQPYKFKSAAHRDMVVLSTRLHLQDLLLQRFGRLRTAECCLLRKVSGTQQLLLLWADLLVQQNPEKPPADAYFVPPELYRLPDAKVSSNTTNSKRQEQTREYRRVRPWPIPHGVMRLLVLTQVLLQRDRELRWLMQRIDPRGVGGHCDSSRDCVPVPHFPSVLQQEVPRFPYEPQQLEMLRDTYGLLKWPFRPVRGAAKAAAAAAVATGSAELPQISQAEPTSEGVAAAVAAVAAAVDRGDVRRANSKVRTRCCTDAIYAPDETETGAYVW